MKGSIKEEEENGPGMGRKGHKNRVVIVVLSPPPFCSVIAKGGRGLFLGHDENIFLSPEISGLPAWSDRESRQLIRIKIKAFDLLKASVDLIFPHIRQNPVVLWSTGNHNLDLYRRSAFVWPSFDAER